MRIAVVRALPGLGDLLTAVPALRALRAAYPRAHIAHIGLPRTAWFRDRFARYVDELVAFPGFPGLPELPVDPERTAAFLRDADYDLALQLHGSGPASNEFTRALGAPRVFGAGDTHPYDDSEPEPLRLLRTAAQAGAPARGTQLEFPLLPGDEHPAPHLGPYVVIHPGASIPERRWAAERFAAVADAVHARGLRPVVTGTTGEEPITRAVARATDAPITDLTGRTGLGGLAALLARATLLVANDTGASHIAAALGTPSVIVSPAADPRRWAPLDSERHRVVPGPCAPTAAVLEAVEAHLQLGHPPSSWRAGGRSHRPRCPTASPSPSAEKSASPSPAAS